MTDPTPMRICRKCGSARPVSDYAVVGGYLVWTCRLCKNLAARERWRTNPDTPARKKRKAVAVKEWRKRNPEYSKNRFRSHEDRADFMAAHRRALLLRAAFEEGKAQSRATPFSVFVRLGECPQARDGVRWVAYWVPEGKTSKGGTCVLQATILSGCWFVRPTPTLSIPYRKAAGIAQRRINREGKERVGADDA